VSDSLIISEVERCPRCLVPLGAEHDVLCPLARCLVTGLQRFACFADHDHGRTSGRARSQAFLKQSSTACGRDWLMAGGFPVALRPRTRCPT
jgi:hypothetical protein